MSESIQERFRCDGKVALVTGGTGWIGASISAALHDIGCFVFPVSRGQSQNFLEYRDHNLFPIIADLSTEDGCHAAYQAVIKEAGRVDILINNSHVWAKQHNFFDKTWEELQHGAVDDFVSPLFLTKICLEKMMERKSGSIVNVASMYGHVSPDFRIYGSSTMGNSIEYGALKSSLVQWTRYLSVLAAQSGVRVNSVSPGPISRPGSFDEKEWFHKNLVDRVPMGRVGRPEEIAAAVAFLASDLSSYTTGADLKIDGGWTAW